MNTEMKKIKDKELIEYENWIPYNLIDCPTKSQIFIFNW